LVKPVGGPQKSSDFYAVLVNACSQKPIAVNLRIILKSIEESSNIYNFSNTVFFHLNRAENGKYNNSSENHLKSSKTSRISYLDLKPIIFVEQFEYYLVIKGQRRPEPLCYIVRASVDGRNIFSAIYLVL
jgi:hypothetical protein